MSRLPVRPASSLRRIVSVARKEMRQLARDKLTMGFVVGVPLVQILLFGYAIDQDVRHVATAVVDHAGTSVSRRLIGQLEATQTFRIVRRVGTESEARRLLEAGAVNTAIVIPPDFTTSYYRGRGAELIVIVNATDPLLARAVSASANGLMERMNRRLQPFVVEEWELSFRAPRQRESFFIEPELIHGQYLKLTVLNFYNPELRTPVFVVPGLLGVILTTTMLLMISLAIVRERERGTFEFLITTPVSRFELMLGKIVPYTAIGFLQIGIVLATGLLLFGIPVLGSLLDLGVSSTAFIAANLALGLVISCVALTQFQAIQMCFFFFLPSVLLSGFMFPFETMPRPAQWIGELLPLTHFTRTVKGVMLRGAPLTDMAVEVGAMSLFFVVGLTLATRLFKKRL